LLLASDVEKACRCETMCGWPAAQGVGSV
jgi:hypothetical protein